MLTAQIPFLQCDDNMKTNRPRLTLLAPTKKQSSRYFPRVVVDEQKHSSMVKQIRMLRNQVYVDEGIINQTGIDTSYDHQDLEAWHLLIYDTTGRTLLGCIRALYFQETNDFPEAESILSQGGIWLGESAERSMLIHVITQYLKSIKRKQRAFLYVGGFAVSRPGQILGHGALLGLGINALGRIIDNAEGLTFARSIKALLFQSLGGYLFDGIDTIHCKNHHCNVQLLGLRPEGVPPSAERFAETIKAELQTQAVIVAN